jgi:hypothetical protein
MRSDTSDDDRRNRAMPVSEETTLPHPIVRWDGEPEDAAAEALQSEPADWDWPSRTAKPGVRLRIPVLVLLALLFAAGGLWGGAALQRGHGVTAASSGASGFAGLFGRGTGTGTSRTGAGASPFGGASSAAAAGTVTAVEGDVVYLTTSSGAIEKVVVGKSTTVTRDAKSSTAALQPGDTAIVQGTKAANGNVEATSIAATG